jgi:hypothetical protein
MARIDGLRYVGGSRAVLWKRGEPMHKLIAPLTMGLMGLATT